MSILRIPTLALCEFLEDTHATSLAVCHHSSSCLFWSKFYLRMEIWPTSGVFPKFCFFWNFSQFNRLRKVLYFPFSQSVWWNIFWKLVLFCDASMAFHGFEFTNISRLILGKLDFALIAPIEKFEYMIESSPADFFAKK